jgi:hypothetical protein
VRARKAVADGATVVLIASVVGILALGGTLSVVLRNTDVLIAALGAAMVVVLGRCIALASSRKRWRERAEQDQRLLAHYCDVLQDRFSYWRIKDWDETVVVDEQGNARQYITVRVLVESEELDFFRVRMGCRWDQPAKYRKKVKVKVRSLEVDGVGGTRPDTTTTWLPDNRLEVLTHFSTALEKDEQLNLAMEIDWPKKAAPLFRGEPDDFFMRFTRYIEKANLAIVLPPGTEVYMDLIGLRPEEDDYQLEQQVTESGTEVRLRAFAIEPYRRFGVRLDRR